MMESERERSVPIIKNLQIEGSWAPITPGKASVGGELEAMYENTYLSRISNQNEEPQTHLSYTITSAQGSSIPSNHLWDDSIHHLDEESINLEMQRRGLEEYLPHWNSQGRRTKASPILPNPLLSPSTTAALSNTYPCLSSWESSHSHSLPPSFQWENNASLQGGAIHDPLANLTFGQLLSLKDSGMSNSSLHPNWNPNNFVDGSSSMFSIHNNSHQFDLQFTDLFGGDMQNCGSLHQYQQRVCDANSPLTTKHANAKNSTFAPATPDLRWRIGSSVASESIPLGTHHRGPNEQNGLESQEQDVAAAMVNLQNVVEEVPIPNTDSSPGKVSTAVENHNPDKGGDQVIDLNKTPQKKTRRRRYQPKVLSEKKPRKTPKPKTPKPTDSKETPRVKRKYVRKNKTKPDATPPVEATDAGEIKPAEADEVGDTETAEGAKPTAKSCRRSLNFDLNGQAAESNFPDVLNGDSFAEPQPNKCHTAAGNLYCNNVHLRQGAELMVEKSRVGLAYDLNRTLNQELENYLSLPTKDYLDNLQPDQNTLSKRKETTPHNLSGNNAEVASIGDAHSAQSPNSSPCASSNERKQRGSKRGNSCITNVDTGGIDAAHCTFWQPNHTIPGNANIGELQKLLHPEIRKKKRTEKVQRLHVPSASNTVAPAVNVNQVAGPLNHLRVDPSTSKYYCCDPTPFEVNAVTRNNHAHVLTESVQNRIQLFNTWADLARLKKKRSKGTTRVRDLAQLMGIASVLPSKPGPKGPRKKKIDISENAYTEALPADSNAKPKARRSKKQTAENKQRGLVLYDADQPTRKATGSIPALPWARPSSIEEITEKMVCLDINRKSNNRKSNNRKSNKTYLQEQNALVPYQTNNQEQNALVVYGRDGTIVPFEGPFEPIRKRRQRAKVDLDDETTKVWKLLLENIDNKGIDGTDEDKTKWWENERSVFRGRVDSFIARMRLVQGDRRFTPWKGSVLDSVIGVFLTQNVSDHLSSSAFMALAAHFPLKSEGSESTLSEESTTALVVEPNICIIEPEESISWNEKTINEQTLSRNSRIIHDIDHGDEKEVVNSKEQTARARGSVSPKDYSSESSQKVPNNSIASNANSQTAETETASILGDDRAKDDATSSQHSVISSQNSTYSPNLQTVGMMSNFLESDSRLEPFPTCSQSNYFDSTSFLGLLKMAENPFLHDSYNQNQHDPLECINHVTKGSPEARGVCSSNYPLNLNFQLSDVKGIEMLEVESKSPDTSRKDENSTPTEQSNLTTESSMQCLAQDRSSDRSSTENMCSCYVLEGEKMIMNLQSEKDASDVVASSASGQKSSASAWKSTNLKSSNSSQITADVTESTTELKRASYEQNEIEQISVQTCASGGITDMTNTNASKSKRGNPGKGKTDAFEWDSLRRDAQANGKKREKTPNTRDSLDWEAVKQADVSEIAETIKERGMNNMLAERIKDLLARLVKDHGSIDMEWLRDIPPDKAKEYLLSFKGLGLKSVECVRLLTLHHLAFPVDTNVGRIAVRLGWVPLQPLPESLQLHLLELYPVLETIQKYLWPRLCKLDQKTLYELHYHLITFGKVFCTKRQPNCNACPLRGECRHFASAFASARFALPGTEERSIVPSNVGSSAHADPQARINLLPLPPSLINQHSQSNPTSANGVLTIEAASSSLALPLQHTINHMERQSKITNCEPIVEVPASPEPEPEQEQTLCDIEDTLYEDPNEIPTIELNMKQFSRTLQDYMTGKSNALVALTPEAASIPTPKLKNISRLRTEHHVYELPDTHPLLKGLDKREPDDPCSYLLAIWTPGETADSIQPPERRCSSEDPSILCNEETCSYCNSLREANSQTVRGTLLIPCRTAMRGSFPLNGTYFQVNEVFADHNSSLNPIAVPRSWLWNLPRRTVYFGTSIPTIFRGLTTEDIQHCFWRGFVCVRGFDQKTRAPRPLMARLHFPASRMPRGAKGRAAYDE